MSDDVLLEIFNRLPHAKDAIRYSVVRKGWRRLISSAEFANKFSNNHLYSDPSFSQPYTLLVKFERSCDDLIRCEWNEQHDCLNAADDQLYTSRRLSSLFGHPTYLPWDPSRSSVRAAAGDLLLITHMTRCCRYELLLCNPLTKQCLRLPPDTIDASVSNNLSSPFGLACHPGINGYRVAFAHPFGWFAPEWQFKARIFNPDTGSWTFSTFVAPRASFSGYYNVCSDDAVTGASGVLYFLLRHTADIRLRIGAITGIVAIDPFKVDTGIVAIDPFKVDGRDQTHSCRMIQMPAGFGRPTKRDVRLAVVRGRLRMSLSSYDNQDGCGGGLDVRVWELRYSNDDERDDGASATWNLVCKFRIAEEVFVVGMHPNDGDVIFVVVRGNNEMCRYHIGQGRYHKIGEIPDMNQKHVKDHLPLYLNVYTLLHTSPLSWPAPPLPTISSATT